MFMRLILYLLTLSVYLFSQGFEYDYLIQGARIVDGTGAPWFVGDVGIKDDKIVDVGFKLDKNKAKRVINADGLYLAPGFIDIHSHARGGLMFEPTMENLLRQGITTVIEGNDGSSPLPLRIAFEEFGKLPLGANIGFFIGHGTVRDSIMGWENRKPTKEELNKMKKLVEEAMKEGAFGLSTGLIYPPGSFGDTDEIIELAKVASEFGGIYITHMRNESNKILDAIEEAIKIGKEAKIPVQITHHKIVGRANWGMSLRTLLRIERAREEGIDITLDQYPYTATHTGITVLIPGWAMEGGNEKLLERLENPELRQLIKQGIIENMKSDRGSGDPANIQIGSCRWKPEYQGKTLAQILKEKNLEPNFENASELVIEIVENGGSTAIYHSLNEEDLQRIMRFPWTMIATDGGVAKPGMGFPHPRTYGTFPRVISKYVRELGLLTLEEAIRKMTSLPALRLKLFKRGLIRPGYYADIVVFDYKKFKDKATFENPHQYSEGVVYLWVNGVLTIDNEELTGKTGGRILKRGES
ncbi:N-acyl-D-amino-acid deacylase family protein [Candidatus Kryptobacter tengchongensis]|uniref:N-acyl-D-amino-acid deacylase family protein n=1 Tax=Kryptobacter tengchongensis TaxID=1643429 RepID=UPI000707DC0B|nr:D-aminoacylase [Candidatus Kryptobacter tengchongensis]CUS89623.1 N-acyl-D-amino-acid deacylase [Candidatus Kryptobacter tengchongensis]